MLRKRRRSLVEVCFEWMSRGDHVTLSVCGDHFDGRLTAAISDLLVLETADLVVAIRVEATDYVRSNQRSCSEGTSGSQRVQSFRAYLADFEVNAREVRLVGAEFDVLGMIDASTDDHVLVVDRSGGRWALPRHSIGYATSSA